MEFPASRRPKSARVEQLDVLEMQPGGGLVEDVERPPGGLARELGRELHPLGLAAGERGGGLAQLDVAEPHLSQRGEPLRGCAGSTRTDRRPRPR